MHVTLFDDVAGPGERDPANMSVGISLHRLQKKFAGSAAISDLDVNVYQDQVTALLGQNGAGKTTCM